MLEIPPPMAGILNNFENFTFLASYEDMELL